MVWGLSPRVGSVRASAPEYFENSGARRRQIVKSIPCAAQMNDLSAGQIRDGHCTGYSTRAFGTEGHLQVASASEKPGLQTII
jgi:hypothetical protein